MHYRRGRGKPMLNVPYLMSGCPWQLLSSCTGLDKAILY
jgi:hypothetical protein